MFEASMSSADFESVEVKPGVGIEALDLVDT